ncbi:MAG: cytochrome c peroxidase [Polyangiaceae bacterium]
MRAVHSCLRQVRAALALGALVVCVGCGDEPTDPQASVPAAATSAVVTDGQWTEAQIALLESLSIGALPPTPPQPSNRVAEEPAAARLGHALFFDPRLSRNGKISCATCHLPALLFTDGMTTSSGLAQTTRNAPTLVGVAHSPWMFWDGRRDSLWAQALGPIETAAEMGSTRVAVVRYVATDPALAALYAQVFGAAPDLSDATRFPAQASPFGSPEEQAAWNRMSASDRRRVDEVFANIGKSIGAYERLLVPGPSRFDRYVENLRGDTRHGTEVILGDEEIEGLRLFIDVGRTLCLRCHNGPLLTNQGFHLVGTASGKGPLPEFGRFLGLQAVLVDPFNCLGSFSDARPEDCQELRFLDKAHVGAAMGKFKTPTLRGLPRTGPYMHDGRFATLEEVIEHYRVPPAGPPAQEITPLVISDEESRALVAFLRSLDGGTDVMERWLQAPFETNP